MAGETIITVIGNLTADPELRFTPSGAAVANFTVASTPRTFDRQSNEWKDGETLFMRCSVWRDAAENVAESLAAGHPRASCQRAAASRARTRPRRARSAPSSSSRSTRSAPRCATPRPRSPRPQRGGGGGGWRRLRRWRRQQAVPVGHRRPDAGSPGRWWLRREPGPWPARPLGQRPLGRPGPAGRGGWGRVPATTSPRSESDATPVASAPRRRPVTHASDDTIPGYQGSSAGTSRQKESTTMAKPAIRKPKKKANPLKAAEGREHRLQGRRAAAQVHLRPRQDPRASGDRCDRAGAAPHRQGRQERP